ncbi:MAG TPA: hypothetical protein VF740_15065, partial [Candidatus Acidoferrum sp.]
MAAATIIGKGASVPWTGEVFHYCALSYRSWAEAYPLMEMPHNFLSGLSYPVLGQYEKSGE